RSRRERYAKEGGEWPPGRRERPSEVHAEYPVEIHQLYLWLGAGFRIPALLTSTSSEPNSWITMANMPCTWSSLATSACTILSLPPLVRAFRAIARVCSACSAPLR